jgi:hypothetical protein
MNVTLKLPDELCRKARHSAVDHSKSLSAWVADLIERELASPTPIKQRRTLVEAMAPPAAPDWFYERDLPLEDRKEMRDRGFSFERE